jgi:DNA-binding PadR family transcriptional regulator
MRRKQGQLVEFEKNIISVVKELNRPFYGYEISKMIDKQGSNKANLYKTLRRLESMGYIESQWELQNEESYKPHRRVYKLAGEK